MNIEIKRQLVHASGIFLIVLISFFGRAVTFLVIVATLFVLTSWALYRINKSIIKQFFRSKFIEKIDMLVESEISNYERSEEFPFKGAIHFYTGSLIALVLFNPIIAAAAIAVLAIADSISTLVGRGFGKHKLPINKKKSFEGSFAFAAATFIVLLFFISPAKALVITLVTTFVEALPRIDDNLTIPFSVGAVIYLLKFL